MVVMAPADENELQHMLATAIEHDGPIAFRYPRGSATGVALDEVIKSLPLGKGQIVENGDDVLILAIGKAVADARAAGNTLKEQGISATVVNCRFVKPLDVELISSLAAKIPRVITVEENVRQGGFGSAVLEALNDAGINGLRVERIGVADTFVEHGPQQLLRSLYGIDAAAIVKAAVKMMADATGLDGHWQLLVSGFAGHGDIIGRLLNGQIYLRFAVRIDRESSARIQKTRSLSLILKEILDERNKVDILNLRNCIACIDKASSSSMYVRASSIQYRA